MALATMPPSSARIRPPCRWSRISANAGGLPLHRLLNFDIKYSGTPATTACLRINLRQGRSNYYVTATGMNIARLVVEKWSDGGTDCVLNKNEVFWHHVPAQVAFTYTEDKDLVARAKALKAQGKGSLLAALQA